MQKGVRPTGRPASLSPKPMTSSSRGWTQPHTTSPHPAGPALPRLTAPPVPCRQSLQRGRGLSFSGCPSSELGPWLPPSRRFFFPLSCYFSLWKKQEPAVGTHGGLCRRLGPSFWSWSRLCRALVRLRTLLLREEGLSLQEDEIWGQFRPSPGPGGWSPRPPRGQAVLQSQSREKKGEARGPGDPWEDRGPQSRPCGAREAPGAALVRGHSPGGRKGPRENLEGPSSGGRGAPRGVRLQEEPQRLSGKAS